MGWESNLVSPMAEMNILPLNYPHPSTDSLSPMILNLGCISETSWELGGKKVQCNYTKISNGALLLKLPKCFLNVQPARVIFSYGLFRNKLEYELMKTNILMSGEKNIQLKNENTVPTIFQLHFCFLQIHFLGMTLSENLSDLINKCISSVLTLLEIAFTICILLKSMSSKRTRIQNFYTYLLI